MARRAASDDDMAERMCVVTRAVLPQEALIRFALDPHGVVTPDIRRKLPGRGVSVSCRHATVAEAVRRKAFARGFKRAVVTPPDLADTVAELLRRDAIQAFAMANKAGAVVAGFGKVEEAIASGRTLILLHARAAAADGRRKLAQAVRRAVEAGAAAPTVIESVEGPDLDMAFGREHVIHAAVTAGPAGANALARWLRYDCFRAGGPPHARDAAAAARPGDDANDGQPDDHA